MGIFSDEKPAELTNYINVIAHINAKPAYAGQVRSMLEALVETSREEEGCEGYHLLEYAKQPGNFCTYEVWSSEDLLNQHLNSDGTKQALAETRPMLSEDMQLAVYKHLL